MINWFKRRKVEKQEQLEKEKQLEAAFDSLSSDEEIIKTVVDSLKDEHLYYKIKDNVHNVEGIGDIYNITIKNRNGETIITTAYKEIPEIDAKYLGYENIPLHKLYPIFDASEYIDVNNRAAFLTVKIIPEIIGTYNLNKALYKIKEAKIEKELKGYERLITID